MQSESFQVWCPHLRWESKQQRVADGQKTKEIYYKWKRVHVQYSEISLSLLFITVNHACVIIHHKCKKTVVYTRVNGALHIENCKNYKKVITHQHIA